MNKYEIIELENKEVEVDTSLLNKKDTLYFNATKLASQFNKRLDKYLEYSWTKEYIEILQSEFKTPWQGELKILYSKKWKYWGTWMHKDLYIDYCRWLDKQFAYKLDKWIIYKLNEEKQRKLDRDTLKTWYLPMTKAIEESHDPAMFYHYSTEADLINRIVTGMSAKQYEKEYWCKPREWISIGEIEIMDKLQRSNTTFIEMELDYEDRKSKLQELYKKYITQLSI